MKNTLLLIAYTAALAAPTAAQELPRGAVLPGECFARVIVLAESETSTRPIQKAEWRQILCEANATPAVIRAIQTALQRESLYSGPIDGRLDSQTFISFKKFQISQNMPTGGLTLGAIDALGVDWRAILESYPQTSDP